MIKLKQKLILSSRLHSTFLPLSTKLQNFKMALSCLTFYIKNLKELVTSNLSPLEIKNRLFSLNITLSVARPLYADNNILDFPYLQTFLFQGEPNDDVVQFSIVLDDIIVAHQYLDQMQFILFCDVPVSVKQNAFSNLTSFFLMYQPKITGIERKRVTDYLFLEPEVLDSYGWFELSSPVNALNLSERILLCDEHGKLLVPRDILPYYEYSNYSYGLPDDSYLYSINGRRIFCNILKINYTKEELLLYKEKLLLYKKETLFLYDQTPEHTFYEWKLQFLEEEILEVEKKLV